jgi:uroporphyrinogen decarboxylase
MIWDEGYRFDAIRWPDDMGYKHNQFFSLRMYRDLVKPVHRRAIEWAHAKGIKAILHSCGDVNPFLPEFIEMGLDGLNPLEVKAGMDPIAIKRAYGDKLLIAAEMRRVVPILKQNGGYIFSSDHSVPSSVSLENFRAIVELAKELGSYE